MGELTGARDCIQELAGAKRSLPREGSSRWKSFRMRFRSFCTVLFIFLMVIQPTESCLARLWTFGTSVVSSLTTSNNENNNNNNNNNNNGGDGGGGESGGKVERATTTITTT